MKKLYLSDSAEIEKDSFSIHTNIGETLYEIIDNYDVTKESFTIGLFGEWGSGKSFIVNKLKGIIQNAKKDHITFLTIDVWKYSGFPLLRSILFDLNNQFKNLSESKDKYEVFSNGFRNKSGKSLEDILYCDEIFESQSKMNFSEYKKALKSLLGRYKRPFLITMTIFLITLVYQFLPNNFLQLKFLLQLKGIFKAFFPFMAFIGGLGIFLPLLQKPLKELGELVFFRNTIKNFTEKANFSPEQFEKTFKEMLEQLKDEKYVIVFDNIDRCEPSLAYETLSTIKTFMDVKNCFYLIPCDDDAIKEFLSKGNEENNSFERKFAEEFIDKIFQTYIRIPYLKEIERDKYIKEQLELIDFENEFKPDEIETITEILYYAYRGESPRNIKRFLNDYSTYFRFAKNSFSKLVDNITLFSVMIAIKQKWYTFEKVLIEHPTFFKDYISDNKVLDNYKKKISEFESLKIFLQNIKFYIRTFLNESIGNYIHFKESEKTIEIVEKLRSSKVITEELNFENLKTLKKEFYKNSQTDKAFSINSFVSWSYLIKNNKDTQFYRILIMDYWKNLLESNIDVGELLFSLYDEEILNEILITLDDKKVHQLKNQLDKRICDAFKNPLGDSEMPEDIRNKYTEIFKALINTNYKFVPKNIQGIFAKWTLDNAYLNVLLKSVKESDKSEYLPNIVLARLKESITPETIELYNYWGASKLPEFYGKRLLSTYVKRVAARAAAINNAPQLTQQWTNIELDYQLLYLMKPDFITDEKCEDFINNTDALIQKMFQFHNNNLNYSHKAIEFWIECIYSIEKNKSAFDTFLTKHFENNLQVPDRQDYLIKNLRYEDSILELPKLKSSIYSKSEKLQTHILSKIHKSLHNEFELLFSLPITLKDINIIKAIVLDNEDSEVSEKDFVNYILTNIITNPVETAETIVSKLIEVDKILSMEGNKNVLKDNKNRFIDLYKSTPSIGNALFSFIQKHLTVNDFKRMFISPLLRYINSELQNTNSVASHRALSNYVNVESGEGQLIELCFNIFEACLSNNQELDENYLGLNLFFSINNYLNKSDKNRAIDLIRNNDNSNSWESEFKSKLIEMEILSDDSTNSANESSE